MNTFNLIFIVCLLSTATLFNGCNQTGAVDGESGYHELFGNAEGYGFINIATFSNEEKAFSVFPGGVSAKPITNIRLENAPRHGSLVALVDSDANAIYRPTADYVGSDTFDYLINFEDGSSEPVKAFVDVKPCFREPRVRATSKNIHVISAITAQRADGYIPIYVAKAEAPVTLYLNSETAVKWAIVPQEGAQVGKIVMRSMYGSVSTVANPMGAKVEYASEGYNFAMGWESRGFVTGAGESGFGRGGFEKFIQPIRDREGKNEASFQGCQFATGFRVPFTPRSLINSCSSVVAETVASHYEFGKQDCSGKCQEFVIDKAKRTQWVGVNVGGTWGSPLFTNGGLGAEGQPGLTRGRAQTNLGQSCGKYYLELKLTANIDDRDSAYTGLALTYEKVPIESNEEGLPSFIENRFEGYKTGDVVGMALDLDGSSVKFYKNGALHSTEALNLYDYSPVFVVLHLTEGRKILANFGEFPFLYNPGSDYKPFSPKE